MVIGFWNVNRNMGLGELLVEFVIEYGIDILLLAEADEPPLKSKSIRPSASILTARFLVNTAQRDDAERFRQVKSNNDLVKVFTHYPEDYLDEKNHLMLGSRMTAFRVDVPGFPLFNLFGIHFHSKFNWTDISQAMECVSLAEDICRVESEVGARCENSTVIGDFNMNPFEPGMIAANGLHAVPDLETAKRTNTRLVDGRTYKSFYNPMWNYLGDNSKDMGEYFYRPSGPVSLEWHLLDQVLIRPVFTEWYSNESVRIVTKINGINLKMDNNRPNKDDFSDHFPLVLKINY